MKKQILITMDDTGSMHGCRNEVRRRARQLVLSLQEAFGTNLEIAVIIHGDYCDGKNGIEYLDFTSDMDRVINFITNAKQKHGGDAPEFYEAVLHQAKSASWKAAGGVLVLIGDSIPHPPHEPQNVLHLDWRKEARELFERGVTIHAVQCLGRREATSFYSQLAQIGGGVHLELAQFEEVLDLILGIAHHQAGTFSQFEETVTSRGDISYTLQAILDKLAGRAPRARAPRSHKLVPVSPSRFQRFTDVPTGVEMKVFIEKTMGFTFFRGCGFYPLDTRREMIQERKEVVLRHRSTGEMFTGPAAREMIGLPLGQRGMVPPNVLADYDVFVQSTSPGNRVLRSTDLAELLWDIEKAEELEKAAAPKRPVKAAPAPISAKPARPVISAKKMKAKKKKPARKTARASR